MVKRGGDVMDQLSALLSQPPQQLNTEFKDGTVFGREDMRALGKRPELLEAWSGKVCLAMEEGLFELAGNLMLLGMEMLPACGAEGVAETNVAANFVQWVNSLRPEKVFSDSATGHHEDYRVFARLLLMALADLLEHEFFAKAMFKEVHVQLTRLMAGRSLGLSAIRVARAAADCFTTATVTHKQNKAVVQHGALVKIFAKAADLPLKESLVIILRKCILNAPQPQTDSQRSAAQTIRASLPDDMYQQFTHSGKTDLGSMEFALTCLEAAAGERRLAFKTLHCPSWRLNNTVFRAKDFAEELGTSGLLHVYAHERYMTLQRPDEGSWLDIVYGNIEQIRYSASESAVVVQVTDSREVLKFDVAESGAGKKWVRAVCDLIEKGCSEVAGSEFFPPPMTLPTPMTAAQERERMRQLQRKAVQRETAKASKAPAPAPAAAPMAALKISGRKRHAADVAPTQAHAVAAHGDALNFDVPEDSEVPSEDDNAAKRRKRGDLLYGLGDKDSGRVSKGNAAALRIDLPQLSDFGGKASKKASGSKDVGGRWEAPDSLLDVNWSCNDDDEESSDDEMAMDRMKKSLSETVLKVPEQRPVEELNSMMEDVQRLVDNTKTRKIDIPREALQGELETMRAGVVADADKVPEVIAKERAVTKDIQSLHVEFVRASRKAKKDYHDLICDLDDVLPNNVEMHEKINAHIETMIARGVEVVQRKEQKKRKKSDAVLKMFNMLTQEFAAKAP